MCTFTKLFMLMFEPEMVTVFNVWEDLADFT